MTSEYFLFGFICLALSALASVTILLPLWRSRADQASKTDIDIYRDQLAEVDRDLARGVLDEAEAERTRTEISRRLLAADAQSRGVTGEAPNGLNRFTTALVVVSVIGTAGLAYWSLGAPGYGDLPRAERLAIGEDRRANRPGQLEAEALIPIPETLDQFEEETQALIRSRRATAFEAPNDPQIWSVLAQTEAAIGQYHRATRAQEKVLSLLSDSANEDEYTRLLDLMVAGTQGYVSPEAETVALHLLRTNPESVPALYYSGLLYAQNDRPDRAFQLWRRVVEGPGLGTMHGQFAANQIPSVAAQMGIDYDVPTLPGPTADDIAAAEDLSPEDRQAMISGMVGQLADRLATEGGPPQDWARLVSSLVVLGDQNTARTVLAEARNVFADDDAALATLDSAAQEAGLTE